MLTNPRSRTLLFWTLLFFLFAVIISCSQPYKIDGTKTVIGMESPAESNASEPMLFTAGNGEVYLSWIERKGDTATLKFSILQDSVWAKSTVVANGADWFLNWADFPATAADAKGNMLAHFLRKSDTGKYTYNVITTSSVDAGKTWSAGKVLHDDGKEAEHGFVSIVPYNDSFFVAWLDGRNTVMEDMPGMKHDSHEGHHGAMTLRAAILSKSGEKLREWELDNRVCDCCQTTAAITSTGPIVIYRDRSHEEVRDMAIVRYENGVWSKPAIVYAQNWTIKGCPVNGPRVDATGNQVAVAWFSAPNDTAAVHVIFSKDGGKHFGSPIRVDGGDPIGRVDIAWLNNESVAVTWMEKEDIKIATVNMDGTKGEAQKIAVSNAKRASGFPQMTRTGSRLIFSWTDLETKTIRTAYMDLE